MNVFISWSKDRSRSVAEILREWLPNVIQSLEPWFSEHDIEKGTQWRNITSEQLNKAKCGIICLTPENLLEPWILFESGALAKTLERTYICTLLLDLKKADLKEPLSTFQATLLDKKDVFRLVTTLNNALETKKLTETQLKNTFKVWWPKLATKIRKIQKQENKKIERLQEDMIEEILLRVRNMQSGVGVIDYILETLTPREEKVLRLKFGIKEERKYTDQEIGLVLGISAAQVNKIITRAIKRIGSTDRVNLLLTAAGS